MLGIFGICSWGFFSDDPIRTDRLHGQSLLSADIFGGNSESPPIDLDKNDLHRSNQGDIERTLARKYRRRTETNLVEKVLVLQGY
jgi:hypothetical protein